jgi:hypothetical protein
MGYGTTPSLSRRRPRPATEAIGGTGAFRNTINAALGRAKNGEGRASAVEAIFGDMTKSLHMKTLTKPLAKMPAGAMFFGGSRKPDTAITQPIPDYVIPFLPIFQDCESGFSILSNLQTKYDWVLGTLGYDCSENLIVRV